MKILEKVLYTDHNSQLVLMSLKPGEEIGEEIHGVDQFLRVEQGNGVAILEGNLMILPTAVSSSFRLAPNTMLSMEMTTQ